jgi:hypothetical protein
MLKINYSKKFDKNEYYKSISKKYFNILKNELLKASIRNHPKSTITIEEIFNYFKINKIGNFDTIFENISFKCLTIGNFRTLEKIKNKIGAKDNEYIELVFNYTDLQQTKIAPFFEENLNISTCYYCNIDFVNTYNVKGGKKNKFTLDHYYDKSTYPYLALSLYNLIPSCYTCNSKLKKTIEFNNLAPSSQKYDFDYKVKFKLKMSDLCNDLHIQNKNDIEINLKENYSNNFKDFIEKMHLDDRYRIHKDIVFDMIQKAELYPESRLKELENLTNIPFQQIKKDIFNLIDENEDLSKQPFSKLIVDMSKELGII